jgi:hypothetical protein
MEGKLLLFRIRQAFEPARPLEHRVPRHDVQEHGIAGQGVDPAAGALDRFDRPASCKGCRHFHSLYAGWHTSMHAQLMPKPSR